MTSIYKMANKWINLATLFNQSSKRWPILFLSTVSVFWSDLMIFQAQRGLKALISVVLKIQELAANFLH